MMVFLILPSAVAADSEIIDLSDVHKAALVEYAETNGFVLHPERIKNEGEANAQYNRLISSICDESGAYPSYYGGAFINEEGFLVVCVTEDKASTEVLDSICNFTDNPNIIIKIVEFSFSELKQVQDNITELMDYVHSEDNPIDPQYEVIKSICSTYTDEEMNALVVQIRYISDDSILAFRRIFPDARFVNFAEGYYATTTASWNPGKVIYDVYGSYLTTGYPAYFTNSSGTRVLGFITAGHSFTSNINVYRANSTSSTYLLGSRFKYQLSGKVDAALIQITDSNYTMSFTTSSGTTLASNMYSIPAQNSIVYKEGANTGLKVGFVKSTSASLYYDDLGITLSDMLKTDALNLHGDSGGVMYIFTSGVYSIVGSLSGSEVDTSIDVDLTSASFLYSYAIKVGNTLSALSCSIW